MEEGVGSKFPDKKDVSTRTYRNGHTFDMSWIAVRYRTLYSSSLAIRPVDTGGGGRGAMPPIIRQTCHWRCYKRSLIWQQFWQQFILAIHAPQSSSAVYGPGLFLAREAKNLYWWPCNKCFYKKPVYNIPSVKCYQSSEKMAKRFQEGFLHPLTPYLRHWHLRTYVDTRKT